MIRNKDCLGSRRLNTDYKRRTSKIQGKSFKMRKHDVTPLTNQTPESG